MFLFVQIIIFAPSLPQKLFNKFAHWVHCTVKFISIRLNFTPQKKLKFAEKPIEMQQKFQEMSLEIQHDSKDNSTRMPLDDTPLFYTPIKAKKRTP